LFSAVRVLFGYALILDVLLSVLLLIGESESLSQSHVFLAAVCVSRGDFLWSGRFHSQVWPSHVRPPPPIFVVSVDLSALARILISCSVRV
jgi:hypothetical protein